MALVFIITISTFFLVSLYLKNKELEKTFVNLIEEIDTFILSGYFAHAEELIYTAGKSANSPLKYKRLLKRAVEISSFTILALISETAYQEYPKDDQILSVYIFALLRNGRSDDAAAVLMDTDNRQVPGSLAIETNINTGNYDNTENILYKGVYNKNASLFIKLYELTNNRKFLIDAVLVYLENGDYKLADTILEGIVSDHLEYRKLQFLIKYDSGKLDSALKMLDLLDLGFTIQEIQLLRIDIKIREGLYEEALITINEFLEIYPDYSWIPYYNLIWLNSIQINPDIENIVNKSIKAYPDNRRLLLIIINYYLEKNKDEEAIVMIEKYIINNKTDNELEIILRELKGASNPEYFVNTVRELVNQDPTNTDASRYLAWNIFENNDIPHLQQFLNQIEIGEPVGWIDFFKALISVEKGDYAKAAEQFESSYELEFQWESLYNLAVLSDYENHHQDAIEYYQKAENSLTDTVDNMTTKSMIRTELASLLFKIKDYENAYRELRNAMDQDKDNLKASFLFNKLEAITY